MGKIITQFPIGIAVEFASWYTSNPNVGILAGFCAGFAPRNADLRGEFCNIFIIFKISPELDLGSWFFF